MLNSTVQLIFRTFYVTGMPECDKIETKKEQASFGVVPFEKFYLKTVPGTSSAFRGRAVNPPVLRTFGFT